MQVFERSQLQSRMLLNMRAQDPSITYFGPGPIRAFFYAVAVEIQHLYYRLFRADLKQDALRAIGSDLDAIGASRGVTRLGPSPSSVILSFTGTVGTVIPAAFQVNSTSGIQYQTSEVGQIVATVTPAQATDTVKIIAQSTTSGAASMVAQGTVTQVVSYTAVSGGTLNSVTNLAPSAGGVDLESDDQYRARIVEYLASINQGTRAFYDAQIKQADPTVVRTFIGRSTDPHAVVALVAARSGATYNSTQLQAIATVVGPNLPVTTALTVSNMAWQSIDVTILGTLNSGFTATQVILTIAANLNQYLNWSTWTFNADIQWDNLLALAVNAAGVANIISFTPSVDIPLTNGVLPKLSSISFTDAATSQTTTVSGIISDFPVL